MTWATTCTRPMLELTLELHLQLLENRRNLDEAQEAKLELVCKKMGIKTGMRILGLDVLAVLPEYGAETRALFRPHVSRAALALDGTVQGLP